MNTVSHKYRQSALLLLTAAIWGSAFVAQQTGMDYVGPFTFNAARNLLGGLTLLPLIVFFSSCKKRTLPPDASSENGTQSKTLWAGGILCGIALFAASALQQIGIQYTTVGKAGFITALYIVLVPVCGLFLRKRVQPKVWLAVLIAVAGLYLLCMTDGSFSLQKGDLLVLACALGFTIHILVIDHFSPLVDGIKMSCIQFFTCSILSAVCMALFETVNVLQPSARLDTDSLCRNSLFWCRLYPADYRAERIKSHHGFSADEPGIRFFRSRRLDFPSSGTLRSRALRLYSDVCSDRAGTASGLFQNQRCFLMPFLFQCKKDSCFASFFLTTACFDDIISLRRSVILPGGLFYAFRKFNRI